MKRIAIVTATRAEYGLLTPLIKKVNEDRDLDLDLMVTGAHLSNIFGHTIDDIRRDGFVITHEIPILEEDNSALGISITMANAIKGFAKIFSIDRPDIVVILGDRTELLGVASAALNECIPIAHIHGGEVTEGAVDDCIRHALSKMSYLHFTSNEVYRKRVIQLGEKPDRVFNVGALGAENILKQELLDIDDVRLSIKELPRNGERQYAVMTFHPVTLENETVLDQIEEICKAMEQRKDIFFLITAANADIGGNKANDRFREFAERHSNAAFTYNLGMKRYLSAVKYASFVIGNSSSGIIEAPILGTPTVNIGDRQKGRLLADTVINCAPDRDSIIAAIKKVENTKHYSTNIYGDGNTSDRIISIIKTHLDKGVDLKKGFYDIY